tara:strand:- start:7795 stop:8094 length:300 start_codon:yes stop_codon:yes gene_type:complete
MQVVEILEAGPTVAWKKQGSHITRKYRCTSGPRKGQVRASPTSCNAPIRVGAKLQMKKNKQKMGGHGRYLASKTKKTDNASRRLATVNRGPKKPRRKAR